MKYEDYKKLRDEAGYTSDYQVSQITHLPSSMFSNWNNGKYKPKLEKMVIIFDALGIPKEKLLESEDS